MKKIIILSLILLMGTASFSSAQETNFLRREIGQVKKIIQNIKPSRVEKTEPTNAEQKKLLRVEKTQQSSGQQVKPPHLDEKKSLTGSCKTLTGQKLINQQKQILKIKQVEDNLDKIILLADKIKYDTTTLKSYKKQLSTIKQGISPCKPLVNIQTDKVDLKAIIAKIKQELQKIKKFQNTQKIKK